MVELLVNHADLLIDDGIPPALLELVAPHQSHAFIEAQWRAGRFDVGGALTKYPHGEVFAWSESEFKRLKIEQRWLLGVTRSSTLEPTAAR